jgi:hypothetical protein
MYTDGTQNAEQSRLRHWSKWKMSEMKRSRCEKHNKTPLPRQHSLSDFMAAENFVKIQQN